MKHLITTHTRAILLMAFMLLLPSAMWADKEAYAQYADGTLTFCYDEDRASHTDTYDMPASGVTPGWLTHQSDITKAVFSESFKDVRPERCAKWFYNMNNLTEIQGIEYLNTSEVNDMSYMFYQCTSLTSLDVSHFSTDNVTTMTHMFKDCEQLAVLDVTSFHTQNVDNMASMFYGCVKLTELDLGTFDTRKVTDMQTMFAYDKGLSHIYVCDLFVVDQVTSSDQMFVGCDGLPNYQLSHWGKEYTKDYLTPLAAQPWVEFQNDSKTLTFHNDNTRSAVIATRKFDILAEGTPGWTDYWQNVYYVVFNESFKDVRPTCCSMWFNNFWFLKSITGLEYLNTSEVTDMGYMFHACHQLTSLDLRTFDTKKVTTMEGMFQECIYMKSLDLRSFNTSNVEDMAYMFGNCTDLKSLDLINFDTRKVTNMVYMFGVCESISSITVSNLFTVDQVTSSSNMFSACRHLPDYENGHEDKSYAKTYLTYKSIQIQTWVGYQKDTKTLTFYHNHYKDYAFDTNKYSLPASGEDPGWLNNKDDIEHVVFEESFKDARPERCTKWFYYMSKLTDITGLEYLNTSSVNDMSSMFYLCSSLPSIDLSHFNTANVTTMTLMFYGCNQLRGLDLTSFNTQKVDNMSYMFSRCDKLTELDLFSFDTRSVTDMRSMFYGDDSLEHIYVSDLFVTDKVTQSDVMFGNCSSLPYQNKEVDKTYAHYNEAENGNLTLRRHFTVGDKLYNVDGYVSPTCYTDVDFTDGEAYNLSPYTCTPFNFTFSSDATASHTRTVSNHWATLCLPFAFNTDACNDKFYSIEDYADNHLTVQPLTGDIAAGTPVLAYVTDGELSVSATGAAVVCAPIIDKALEGTFQQIVLSDEEYIIANDHFWNTSWLKQNNADIKYVYVAPYRASLTLSSIEAKPNSISIGAVTDRLVSLRQDSDLSAFLDGAELYDLQGRRLTAPQHGMMIVRKGGVSRKVAVK